MEQYNNSELILKDKKTLTMSELDEKWADFKKSYPKLYSLLVSNNEFDMSMLKFICKNVDEHKKLSKEEQLNLEVNVGKKLANKYIYSQTNLPKPTSQQEEFIKSKLKEKIYNKEDN
tara:strand:- start:1260 stop:1610 length:351 start_codon:yes stop_codon:yes gene_type:complete